MARRLRRTKRKVRWGRLLFLLLLLGGMIWGAVRGVAYAVQSFTPPPPPPKVVKPASPYADKAGKRINVLLIGIDDPQDGAAGQADAVALLSINPEDHSLNVLSIPRDTMVALPGRQGVERLGQAYAFGGDELMVRTVEHALQVPIMHHATVDARDFAQLVNLIGGVEIYVDQNMKYEDPYANFTIQLNRGYQHLNGEQAGQYVRYRSDDLGDLGRVQRQQLFLRAAAEQVLRFETLSRLPDLWKQAGQLVRTDLGTADGLHAIAALRGDSLAKLRIELLPGQPTTLNGQSYWQPDATRLQHVTEELFYANNGK